MALKLGLFDKRVVNSVLLLLLLGFDAYFQRVAFVIIVQVQHVEVKLLENLERSELVPFLELVVEPRHDVDLVEHDVQLRSLSLKLGVGGVVFLL